MAVSIKDGLQTTVNKMVSDTVILDRYTCPRYLKMNAFNKRFNHTIQKEFVIYHEDLLMKDLRLFNGVLFEYLGRYNFRRPHYSSDYQPQCSRSHPQHLLCPI